METKRFKLIDKEGYCSSSLCNERYEREFFKDGITPPLIPHANGWRCAYDLEFIIGNSELAFFEPIDFTLKDLVPGKHVVKLRGCDSLFLVMACGFLGAFSFTADFEDYKEDMTTAKGVADIFDIVEVFTLEFVDGYANLNSDTTELTSVWKRENEEVVKLEGEIKTLKEQLKEKEDKLKSLK